MTLRWGHRLAVLLLLAAAVEAAIIAGGEKEIGRCFAASLLWLAGLAGLRRWGVVSRKGIAAGVVKNAVELAAILICVTGALTLVARVLSQHPPDRILAWSESFKHGREILEQAEKISGRAAWGLCGLYLFALWGTQTRQEFSTVWKVSKFAGKWIKRAALAALVVAAFSITANRADGKNPWDSPKRVLDEPAAEALRAYNDLVWKIELALGKELKLEVVSALLKGLPDQEQVDVQREARVVFKQDQIPPVYFSPGGHMPLAPLLEWNGGGEVRTHSLESVTLYPPWQKAATVPPSARDFTRSSIRRASETLDHGDAREEVPAWMNGPGKDVLQKFFDAGWKFERDNFLHELSRDYPLLAEILDVAMDSIKDAIFDKVHERAGELAARAARNGGTGLFASIRLTARQLAPQPLAPPTDRMKYMASGLDAHEQAIEPAKQRMARDEREWVQHVRSLLLQTEARMAALGVTPAKPKFRKIYLKGSQEPIVLMPDGLQGHAFDSSEMTALRATTGQLHRDREAIAQAMFLHPDEDQWREGLGGDYDMLHERATALRREADARVEQRHQSEILRREIETREREAREVHGK